MKLTIRNPIQAKNHHRTIWKYYENIIVGRGFKAYRIESNFKKIMRTLLRENFNQFYILQIFSANQGQKTTRKSTILKSISHFHKLHSKNHFQIAPLSSELWVTWKDSLCFILPQKYAFEKTNSAVHLISWKSSAAGYGNNLPPSLIYESRILLLVHRSMLTLEQTPLQNGVGVECGVDAGATGLT